MKMFFILTVPSSPPQNIVVTSINPASLNVSWQLPPEEDQNWQITGYVIKYTRNGVNDMIMSVNVTNGTTHTISKLVESAEYSVMVAAINVHGTGAFSTPVVGKSGEKGEIAS